MTAQKTKRNARSSKAQDRFQISRNPHVRVAASARAQDLGEHFGLPHGYGPPLIFAIARDPHTIFVSWNIDWRSVFETTMPVDRQVHLRVHVDGSEEQSMTVEPMASVHYITTSRLHHAYRVDIGYYQPADVWHSIATSNEILMPRNKIAEATDVDLATIPLHLSFQQLLDSFGVENDVECASVISRLQKHALNEKVLTADRTKVLQTLEIPLPEIAKMWRGFDRTDYERLAKRSGALLGFDDSSPARAFHAGPSSKAR